MKRRLYLQLYLTLLASTVLCLLAVGVAFRLLRQEPMRPGERVQRAAVAVLEAAEEDAAALGVQERLAALGREQGVDLVVWEASGAVVARASEGRRPPLPFMRPGLHRRFGPSLVIAVGDGRLVGIRARPEVARRWHPFSVTLLVVAVAMAIASYPVARRITRRLEALEIGVERWGRGDLARRIAVDGSDEVARLAERFNAAAARIEELVAQQRQTLANASHELRSPLARIRMAVDLMAEEEVREKREAKVAEISRDVVDLDALIEDLLLMSRADAGVARRPFEPVALRALVVAEAERLRGDGDGGGGIAVTVSGDEEVTIAGDAVLLRHLVRNLLENARLHGGGEVTAGVAAAAGGGGVLRVEDRGPGIPEGERERVFAPFYRLPGARRDAGTGVGLALVRQVARYHGGDARVEEREGGGSRFEVRLSGG